MTSQPLACVASRNHADQYRSQPTNRYQPIIDRLLRKPAVPLSTCTKRRNRTLPWYSIGSRNYAMLPPSYPKYLTKHRNHHDPAKTDHRPVRPSAMATAMVSHRRRAIATATKMHCQHSSIRHNTGPQNRRQPDQRRPPQDASGWNKVARTE